MSQFHEHPDGTIVIRTPNGNYVDTPENFVSDFLWQLPRKPDGIVERIYDDSGRHAFMDAKSNHVGNGEVPWAFGDRAIAAISELISRKATREAALMAKASEAAETEAVAVQSPTPPLASAGPTNTKVF